MLSIMSEVAGAASAAAGLILVFFGASLASFDSYDEAGKNSVRAAYRWRAWPALGALICAIIACGASLYAKAANLECWALVAVIFLSLSGIGIIASAIHAVSEIG